MRFLTKVTIPDFLLEFRHFVTFGRFFARIPHYLGVLPGVRTRITHLFRIILVRHPSLAGLIWSFLLILVIPGIHPVPRQELHPLTTWSKPGPNAASRTPEGDGITPRVRKNPGITQESDHNWEGL